MLISGTVMIDGFSFRIKNPNFNRMLVIFLIK